MSEIQKTLTKLIDIPSITGNEKEVGLYLLEFLESKGMQVQLFEVEKERFNLFASFSKKPSIILTTHMDTVAPFIKSEIKDNTIYGRGACDAKGQISAMMHTVLELEDALKDQVGLLFVIGEEVNSIGAKSIKKMGIKPKYFINEDNFKYIVHNKHIITPIGTPGSHLSYNYIDYDNPWAFNINLQESPHASWAQNKEGRWTWLKITNNILKLSYPKEPKPDFNNVEALARYNATGPTYPLSCPT